MTGRRGVLRVAGIALALLALVRANAAAHPLHTTLAQLAYDAPGRTLTVSLRVFADDFGAAVARSGRLTIVAGQAPPDVAMSRYVAARFALAGPAGNAIPLTWCGVRRAGEMMFLCLRGPAAAPPNGMRLRNTLLVEAFTDQVNIVQYVTGGTRRTSLFTAGDGVKQLP